MNETPMQENPPHAAQVEVMPQAGTVAEPRYAGFWIRFVAAIIDSFIVGVVNALVTSIIILNAPADSGKAQIVGLALGLLYYAYLESSSSQATLGKRAMGIKVTDVEGHRITFGKAALRYVSKIVSGIILLIGFIMAGFTAKKQGLHDMIAGTLVVRK